MTDNRIKVYSAAVIGHTFWGFSFMASRTALDRAHMLLLLSHRFVIAFAVMSLLVLTGAVKLTIKGKNRLPLYILGLAEPVVYFLGEQYGILHSNTIFSGVMIAMIPIACIAAAVPFLKEYPTAGQVLFSLLSVLGVIGIGLMSSSSGSLDFGGVLGLIIAVLAAVVYTLLNRHISGEFSAFDRTYMMIAIGAAVFTVMAAFICRGDIVSYVRPLGDVYYLLSILFLAVCCSVGSYFMSSYSLTYLSIARETVFANLTTAVSVFAGAVLLHEPFTAFGLVCCIMILVGIYGVQRSGGQDRREEKH